MKIAMQTTVNDLVRALRWRRNDLLDAVMVRPSMLDPGPPPSARALLRRARLKRDARQKAQAQ